MKNQLRIALGVLLLCPLTAGAQIATIVHLAGSPGGASYEDGTGTDARLHTPLGVAADSQGNVYVADSVNHTIRRVSPAGVVSTFAGRAGVPGAADGVGGAALLNEPAAVAVGAGDVVYVADSKNHTIRQITPDRVVSTLAGLAGSSGTTDASGAGARFSEPGGVVVDTDGSLVVADTLNHTLRRVTLAGDVTTIAGRGGSAGKLDGPALDARFQRPTGVGVAADGAIYVADSLNHAIRRLAGGVVTTFAGQPGFPGEDDGALADARFNVPRGIAVDGSGGILVADSLNHTLRRIASGVVITVVGLGLTPGAADGVGTGARLSEPSGVAVDGAGNVFIADTANHAVRKLEPDLDVTTVAGFGIHTGTADGAGAAARFRNPIGVAADAIGNVYVADVDNHSIRKVTLGGAVSTLAGAPGLAGFTDGAGPQGRFRSPQGVAVSGSVIAVADTGNHTIRTVTPTGIVSTLAGQAGSPGAVNGTGPAARFTSPRGVAVDSSGNVYVADTGNHAIRKIAPGGIVTTLAGQLGTSGSQNGTGTAARFSSPSALAVDQNGNVLVADTGNSTIRRITPAGLVTTLAGQPGQRGSVDGVGTSVRFTSPTGIAYDGGTLLFVADSGSDQIRRVRVTTGETSTVAGLAGVDHGATNATGTEARFNQPRGVAVDSAGRLTISDTGNHALRRGIPRLSDRATIDSPAGPLGAPRTLGVAPGGATSWQWSIVRRPSGSTAELSALNAQNPTFTPDVADLYVFRLFAQTQTTASISTVSLSICGSTPPVVVRTDGAEPSCAGASITIDAGEGYTSYKWSTGAETRTITVSPLATTTYSVTVVAGTGCSTPPGTYTHVVSSPLQSVTIVPAPGLPPDECGSAAGATFGAVDSGGGAVSHAWGYRLVSGGPITPIEGATGSSYTVRLEDFPGLGAYFVVATGTPSCGNPQVSNELAVSLQAGATSRLVPIVLDVTTATAHFTTELALTNRSSDAAAVTLRYTAALGGSPQGSGTVSETLAPGRQLVILSVLDYLREKGLPIPAPGAAPQQGGSLLVTFDGVANADALAVTARTTALTAAPQPVGAAGLSYTGIGVCDGFTGTSYVYGLRSNDSDRSNLAVFNTGDEPVAVKVTLTGDGKSLVVNESLSLPPYGWAQLTRVLDGTGISNGFATLERVAGGGGYGAYGVVNDNATNDGSFLEALPGGFAGPAITLPVLIEIRDPRFASELVVTNRGAAPANLAISYLESLSPGLGAGGTVSVTLGPGEQRIIPNAIDFLRKNGAAIGAANASSYAGAARVTVTGVPIDEVFVGARAAALSPAGGQFGLFVPPVYPGQEASAEAWVYGLAADATHRSNVAVYNAGSASDGAVTLELQAYDGDAAGAATGSAATVALEAGQWAQLGNFLKNAGVANGWVRIRRIAGSAPWSGYGVVNDGATPGERTGDGAFVGLSR